MNHDPRLIRHMLITGLPGCGKTTLLKRLAHELRTFRPAGFYTEEIRAYRQRKGFRLIGLDGTEGLLAHVDLPGRTRVGKYGVAVDQFEGFLNIQQLDQAAGPLVFIDEIGKMECLCPRFVALVRHLLDSPRTVVATVAFKGSGLIAEVKRRPDAALTEVNPGNRDRLVEDLAKRIAAMVRG